MIFVKKTLLCHIKCLCCFKSITEDIRQLQVVVKLEFLFLSTRKGLLYGNQI